MDEGAEKQGADVEERVPASEVICEVAPEEPIGFMRLIQRHRTESGG
jgi:hypothetical protein